ncbi:unnamed protein product [Macrosiphum euphorbiae]|uniref:Uncharacterized protein n=1 Tax=Macrosiphum euphorbiae TaxID=13131 RepID=A0AAV0XS39_9HEMI|nr:unnamed protein product [Macrosiphum euphorbiae]
MEEVRDRNNNIIICTPEEIEERRLWFQRHPPIWENMEHPSTLKFEGEDGLDSVRLMEFYWPLVQAYKRTARPMSVRLPNGRMHHFYDRLFKL